MPSRMLKCIPVCQYERLLPLKWRNVRTQLENRKKGREASFDSQLRYTGFLADTDGGVNSLLTTLQDSATRGHLSRAMGIFSLIQGHALASPSSHFLLDALSVLLVAFTKFKLLLEGKQLHAQAITSGFDKNYAFVPKLVSFYRALDLLDDAYLITSSSNVLHPFTWNSLISSYVSKGCFQEAIFAYEQMCNKGITPDQFTYPSVIKACALQLNIDYGREVHKSVNASSLNSNLFVQNALISMYGKFGDLATARSIFDRIPVKDDVSCNSMIFGYISMGKLSEASELSETMREAGFEFNILTWNMIVGGFLKAGDFEGALELIRKMRIRCKFLDPVSVVDGLKACSEMSALKLGKELHGFAVRNLLLDHNTIQNSLITLYCRCQDFKHARMVFTLIEEKTIISWNSIVSGFAQWDCLEDATFLFRNLFPAGYKPNVATLASILPVCARFSNLRYGKELHCYILRDEELATHLRLWNALIEVYARSGRVTMARRLFDLLEKKDVITYTSMITGYGLQGNGKIAVQLFKKMEKSHIEPDAVAMVAVLSACSHSGLVSHGQHFFRTMQHIYGLTPNLDHFSCMADLYGRAGLLHKAKDIILRMPYEPTAEMWATLIGACSVHGNTEIGEWAADRLLEMKSQQPGHYALIANMYAAAGFWRKLAQVRTLMRDMGVVKDPGCAWVDLGAGFSQFTAEDTSNSQVEEIYSLLVGLGKHMKDIITLDLEYSLTEEGLLP